MTRRLVPRNSIDVYTSSSAEQDFGNLRPYCAQHTVYTFTPLRICSSPFGRLNQGIRVIDLLRLKHLQREIAEQIDRGRYDVVFVHHCRFGQSPSLLQFLKTPSVYYCQEPPRLLYEPQVPRPYLDFTRLQRIGNVFDPLPSVYRRILARLDRANVQAATQVLANSCYSRETLYRVYEVFASVNYLGVDVEHFRPLPVPKKEYVLSVGALHPHKGFDFLIRSLGMMSPSQRPPLVIVSNFQDARERCFLAQLASEQKVSVTFRTMISDPELVRLYNQAQLTLYAPIMEPFGFVPLESMACGTPVVAVREAGVRESVEDQSTGLLVERDPSVYAAAVAKLLSNDALRLDMGKYGRDLVEQKWQWSNSVKNLEHHLALVTGVSRA